MNKQDLFENYADVILRTAVKIWAKANPKSLEIRTHTHVNGKRYLIHIERGDNK